MNIFLVLIGAVILSLTLAGLIRRYALSHNLLDVPNARSSHNIPTPRGGGVAFIASFLLFIPLLTALSDLSWPMVWAFFGGGLWVALIGFWDDHGHIAARWRLLAHLLGAGWVLFWLGGFPPLLIAGYVIDLGGWGHLLAAVYLVWLLNLYNFMDGIDGIASIEAVTVCAGVALLCTLQDLPASSWLIPLLLASSVLGFLFWNFPPAKIFMGDVGSSFIGLMVGAFSIHFAWIQPHMFWAWLILLGTFIVDATLTLFRRLIKGEKIYEAHSSHTYQVAARYYNSHKRVSLTVGLINLFWLLPVGFVVSKQWMDGLMGLGVAYAPLVGVFVVFSAIRKNQK